MRFETYKDDILAILILNFLLSNDNIFANVSINHFVSEKEHFLSKVGNILDENIAKNA